MKNYTLHFTKWPNVLFKLGKFRRKFRKSQQIFNYSLQFELSIQTNASCIYLRWSSNRTFFNFPAGEIPYKALGCYRDNHNLYRPLPEQLFSDSQETIDFKDWPNYLSDVICRYFNMLLKNYRYMLFGTSLAYGAQLA